MTKTMMESPDVRHATLLFYTDDKERVSGQLYKADSFKDVDEKSVEEKKAELCLTLALAKVYYSLKQDKRVTSPSDTRLYCKNKAFTEAWANEITRTLDGGVNRPCGQLLRSQYIAREDFPMRAAMMFQGDIRRAKESRAAPSAQLFNPWQKN